MATVRLAIEAMATRFEFVAHGSDARRLRASGEEALREVEFLDRQMSAYRPDSDLAHINASAAARPVTVEPRLFALLRQSRDINGLADGAFDITVRPLLQAWGLVRGTGALPSDDELESARLTVGMDKLVLDETRLTVRFARPGVQIDLGAIGKGYAIGRAVEILREQGVECALIHGGTSSVHGIGSPPDQPAWHVALQPPRPRTAGTESPPGPGEEPHSPLRPDAGSPSPLRGRAGERLEVIALRDASLSVSAAHGKSFSRDGETYGHVIDPRTGRPAGGTGFAAVVGPDPTTCDALSTALLVLGREWIPKLENRFPGYRGIA